LLLVDADFWGIPVYEPLQMPKCEKCGKWFKPLMIEIVKAKEKLKK
jgi:hypothetical protein